MLLTIDTATEVASISLYQDHVLAEITWFAGQNHSRSLLIQIKNLLALPGQSLDELTAVAVSLGPGSFNALRVGITTAKAIALARQLPIVGIETLRSTAYQYRMTFRPTRPLFKAGLREVATGLYQASEQLFATLEEPRLATLDDALNASPPDTLFCGELRPEWREAITDRFGKDCVVPRPAEGLRRAGYLAELAWYQLQSGLVDDVATLQPRYLRRPSITQPTHAIRSAR